MSYEYESTARLDYAEEDDAAGDFLRLKEKEQAFNEAQAKAYKSGLGTVAHNGAGIGRPQLSVVPEQGALNESTVDDDQEDPLAWQKQAVCAQTDPEAFFPEKGGSTREAKRICLGCEVKDQCLDYALENDERFGIWGGLSERERRRLKRGII